MDKPLFLYHIDLLQKKKSKNKVGVQIIVS